MDNILHVLEQQLSLVTKAELLSPAFVRSEMLFLQSMVSTSAVMVVALPTFLHPYLPKLLSHLCYYSAHYYSLPDCSKEQQATMQAIESCFSTVGNRIPPRLLVPVLVDSVQQVFDAGHETTLQYVQMIRSVVEKAERGVVLSQLSTWLSLSLAILDYRRSHGDRGTLSEQVEYEIYCALTELCLKFTETELKAFITQINDWKNKGAERNEISWTKEARHVSFYGLAQYLLGKLQFLFHPTFSLFWSEMPETMKYIIKTSKKVVAKHTDSEAASKSSKKRQREGEGVVVDEGKRQLLDELLNLAALMITCIHSLCADTDVPFMNEVSQLAYFSVQCFADYGIDGVCRSGTSQLQE
jgi:hypothetical protein